MSTKKLVFSSLTEHVLGGNLFSFSKPFIFVGRNEDHKTNLSITFAVSFKSTDKTVHGDWTPTLYGAVVPPEQLRFCWCGNCTCSGSKNTTLVFRATMQNTALGSDEKLITSKWNRGLIPQSIALLDRLPACSLILWWHSTNNGVPELWQCYGLWLPYGHV